MQVREKKFDSLIEKLYGMEWNKLREDNTQELLFMRKNIDAKIRKAQEVLNSL